MSNRRFIRQNIFPVLAALIWGTAFVVQSICAQYLGPFTFNATRSLVAFFSLLVLALAMYRQRMGKAKQAGEEAVVRSAEYRRDLILGGVLCGTALTISASFQQAGLETTSSGKAGFITAMYIVIVPVFGVLFHKKLPVTVWAGVALAVVGLYFLCIREGISISKGDFYIFLCAIGFSGQILLVDHFAQRVDGVALSCVQALTMALLSGVMMMAFETPDWAMLVQCFWPIMYMGVFSGAVAYTLQIMAQRDSNPTVVSLLLSLEAVFAVIGGALILHESMSGREYLGCALMLGAVVLAQLPEREKKV